MYKQLFLALFVLLSFNGSAQYFDFGVQGGFANYQGDLTPETLLTSVGQSHSMIGGFIRYNINPRLSARINVAKTTISGDDSKAGSENRRRRNLNFVSPLDEIAIIAEINIFRFIPNSLYKSFSPYIFGGVAGFRFNPQTEHQERFVDLQSLGTEGQGLEGFEEPYSLKQISIPMGLGFKYTLNEDWSIALELGGRKTFTDHLDDVGGYYVNYFELLQGNGGLAATLANRTNEFLGEDNPVIVETGTRKRGNPDNKDWYLMASINVSYNLIRKDISSGSLKSSHFGCPKRF